MTKILITGACGFIGSHLAELCVKNEIEVVAFDRYNSNNNWGWLEKSKYKDAANDFKNMSLDMSQFNIVTISTTVDISVVICVHSQFFFLK